MSVYAFGPFVLDVHERRLTRDGRRLPLAGKALEILQLLVEAGGRLVERETFNTKLWPDVTVEERNLTVQISALRKVLAADGSPAEYIETVARAGYRMAVPVRVVPAPGAEIAPSDRPRPSEAEAVLVQARTLLNQAERVPALRALGLFERVLALDPASAAAHAGLASTYLFLTSTTIRRPLPVDEAARLARESAHRALALDERRGEAHAVLGWLKMDEWDWPAAEAHLVRGVTLDPASVEAADAHGRFLSAVGRHAEAVETLVRARRLDPLRRQTLEHLGLAHWMAGDADRALTILADASAVEPEARRPHFRRMVVLDQLGRSEEAMEERTAWLKLFGDAAFADRLAVLHRSAGYRAAVVEWIAMLERLNQWFEVAIQWMALDDPAPALDALERAVAERSTGVAYILQYPSFHTLRSGPRYEQLVDELKLEGRGEPVTAHREDNIAILRPSRGARR